MRPKNRLIPAVAALVIAAGAWYAVNHRSGAPVVSPPSPPAGSTAQFADFQKTHRYTLQMMKLLGSIGRMEESGRESITPAQAKSILAIVDPLRKQRTLEEEDAKKSFLGIQSVLTDPQRTAISQLPAENRFRRGGRMPGPPPGAAGPPAGSPGLAPGGPGPGAMNGFNPLNPPEPPQGAKTGGERRGPGRFSKLFDDLKTKSEAK